MTSTIPYCASPTQFYLQFNTTNEYLALIGYSEEVTGVSNISDANVWSLDTTLYQLTTWFPGYSTYNAPYARSTGDAIVWFLPVGYPTGRGPNDVAEIQCFVNTGPPQTLSCAMADSSYYIDDILMWCEISDSGT